MTVDLKGLANVMSLARFKLPDESGCPLMLMVHKGRAYPIRHKDLGLLDPIRLAGVAEDLKGGLVRCNEIQSCIQQ
jgi:hypothetical protein